MASFFPKREIVALYPLKDCWLLIHMVKEGSGFRCLRFEKIKGSPAELKLQLSDFVSSKRVATMLKSSEGLTRQFELPLVDRRSINKTLPFQAENTLPFSENEAYIWPVVKKIGKKRSSVTFFAAARKKIFEHIAFFRSYYIEPEVISYQPLALYSFVSHFMPKIKDYTLLHVEENEAELMMVGSRGVQHSKSFPYAAADELKQELLRAFYYFKTKEMTLSPFLLTGQAGIYAGFLIDQGLKILPWPLEAGGWIEFAAPYGLALNVLKDEDHSLQFRQAESFSIKRKAEAKKVLYRTASALFLPLLALFLFLSAGVKKEKSVLMNRLDEFIEESDLKSLDLTHLDFYEKLARLNQEAGRSQKGTELFDPAPKVSDLLYFLATYPELKDNEGLKINKLHYELLNYPTLEKPFVPYKIRVDLELTTTSTMLASQFYDALRKEKAFIDLNEEITWNRGPYGYQVSFFLR
ncbi:MAG: hypothetical protein WDZ28_00250 [Simkaniaceae bacterium]